MRYPDGGRFGGYTSELRAAFKRRKEGRAPRVRIRIGHDEARVLQADDPISQRVLELATRVAGGGGPAEGKGAR